MWVLIFGKRNRFYFILPDKENVEILFYVLSVSSGFFQNNDKHFLSVIIESKTKS